MKKNEVVRLEITGMTNEGNGVGRYEDMAVFVPCSAVGDILDVRIVKVLKSYSFGIVDKIITPSQTRCESNCEVSDKCGGCSFRHINYEAELEIKDNFVRDAFKRLGKLDIPFEKILGCDNDDFYRNKAQYPVTEQNGKAVCGFYAKRSHRVVPFTACRLQPEIFKDIVDFIIENVNILKLKAYNEVEGTGILRHIYIRKGFHTNEIMVCFVVTKWCDDKLVPLAKLLCDRFSDIKSVVCNLNSKNTNVIMGKECRTICGSNTITDVMCGNKIDLSPLSFYQVNTAQAEKLYGIAKEFADLDKDKILLDLYCGAGTIGLSMADSCKSITGVEIIPEAIENAKKNAELNGIRNAEFVCGDAGTISKEFAQNGKKPNVIIVDPPRKGCDNETLNAINQMLPDRVVYISCNPATCARDCAILNEMGFKPVKARAVDLFARTTHVETVVLLKNTK